MTDKFQVVNVGTDSSGRPILMTRYMKSAIEAVRSDWRIKPFAEKIVVTQGAFMGRLGGGATASAGYHDLAGCVDFRIWNLTDEEAAKFVWVLRCYGFAAWRRIARFGWTGEEHIHATLGGDSPYSVGARDSWVQYVNGTNGLVDHGPDRERRPSPLVTSFTGQLHDPEDDALTPEDRDFIKNQTDIIRKAIHAGREGSADRDKKILAALEELETSVKDKASKEQVKRVRAAIVAELKDDVEVGKSFESSH